VRVYDDDTTIDDKLSCDQLSLVCDCGHSCGVAWAHWSREMKFTPLRRLRPRMACQRCGKRNPTIIIHEYGDGGQMRVAWRWPKA